MHVLLVGGPTEDDDRQVLIPVPAPFLPPYVCSGDQEPFQHYQITEDPATYRYAGECRYNDHPLGYPHEHEELGW